MNKQTREQFRQDCEDSGLNVVEYRGRCFYDGPAVCTDEEGYPTLQDVIRATNVKVQWDNLGLDYIVYPA